MEDLDNISKEHLLKENELLKLRIAELEDSESDGNGVEEALKKSNSLLSSIIESPDNIIMFALDTKYNYLGFNKAHVKEMKAIYGADIEVGKFIFSLMPNKEDTIKAEINYKRVLKGERFIEIQEYGDTDNRFWYELIFNPIYDELKKVTGFTVFVTNITNRKQTEIALTESSELLINLTAQIPGTIYQFLLRPDGTSCFPYSSIGIKDIYGVTPEQVKTSAELVFAVLHPDDLASVSEKIQQSADELSLWRDEYRVILPDEKEPSWREGFAMPERLEDGSTLWHGFITNIDKRKQVEEVIKKSENRLKEAQHLAKIGNWELDLITDKLVWSDEVFRIFDVDQNSFKATYDAFLDNIHPDDREYVNKAYTVSLQNKSPYDIVHRLMLKDGRIKYVKEHCETFYNEDDKAIRSIGTVQDISELKEIEKELRTTSDYLENLINYANAPIIVWDPDFIITRFNHAFEYLSAYKSDEVIGKKLDFLFPASSAKETLIKIGQTSEGENWESVEIPILRKDDEIRIALWNSASLYAEDGKTVVSIIAQGQDITKRKLAQEDLAKHREHLEVMINERTKELNEKNKKLDDAMKVFVGREMTIRNLQDRIKALEGK